jgi:hypothetical protein
MMLVRCPSVLGNVALTPAQSMGSGKDNAQRKRKAHGPQEQKSREEAVRKKAAKLAATKAAAAKQDAANQQQQAIGKKGSTIQQLLSGTSSSAQLLTGHQVGML